MKIEQGSNYSIHGIEVQFLSDSRELKDEINLDLKWFQKPSIHSPKIQIQCFLDLDENNPFFSPPKYSRVIWKNSEGNVISYFYNDLTLNYYFRENKKIAFEILDLNKHRSLCFGDHIDILYEISLLNLERQIADLLEQRDIFFLHAAALEKAEKGVIFPATSSFGKTNLTLSLLKRDFRLLSDDKIFIDVKERRIKYYPRRLRVDKDTVSRHNELKYLLNRKPFRFHKGKTKWLIDYEEIDVNICRDAKLESVIFPTIWINEESRLIKMKIKDSVSRLIQSFENSMNLRKRKAVFDLITDIPCFALLMGNQPEKLADLIMETWENL